MPTIADELHAMLMKRADDLEGWAPGSDEERELAAHGKTEWRHSQGSVDAIGTLCDAATDMINEDDPQAVSELLKRRTPRVYGGLIAGS